MPSRRRSQKSLKMWLSQEPFYWALPRETMAKRASRTKEPLEGSPISNLSSDPSGPFETEIDSGMEDLDTSGDFPDSEAASAYILISKYSHEADRFDKAAMRKHAAHVAAWIAYGPPGRIPDIDELQLLQKFIDKLGAGMLPARLREVLPDVQTVLRRIPVGEASEAWQGTEQQLRLSFQKFRCCRQPANKAAVRPAGQAGPAADPFLPDGALAVEGVLPEENKIFVEEDDQGSAGTLSQHLQLFRKINEWCFLDSAQRTQRLQQAEEAAKHRNASAAELVEVVHVAAAALSAPRRQATGKEEAEWEGSDGSLVVVAVESRCLHSSQQVDVQRRARLLLLQALCSWRRKRFDCHNIEDVLQYVQAKIDKFERNVGQIQIAAAGNVWLSIKSAVDELLQQGQGGTEEANIPSHASRTTADTAMRRLERQSGIQHISWQRLTLGWQVSWHDGMKRNRTLFSICKFLKLGLGEEDAVKKALDEAKALREELVRQGKLQPAKPITVKASAVRGVHKKGKAWQVRLTNPITKKLFYKAFATMEDAEAKARKIAKKFGLQAESEVVPVKKLSELRRFEPLSPQKGVKWDFNEQCWHARFTVGVQLKHFRARPKTFSNEEVENAWNQAASWRRQQEKANEGS
eukprot:s6180_g2.t2